jgi:hypothetical protein
VDLWNLALAAVFFCAMGVFAGVAALYLTATPVRPLGHQAAEIVLFCLFAIALFAVIATLRQTTREITPKRPTAWLGWDLSQGSSAGPTSQGAHRGQIPDFAGGKVVFNALCNCPALAQNSQFQLSH